MQTTMTLARRDDMPRLPHATEAQEQAALMSWVSHAQQQHPELRLLLHIPNGGLRTKRVAAQLQRLGVRPGVPDLLLPVARGRYHGLWIELKAQPGRRVSAAQEEWLRALEEQGYFTVVCVGWEAARRMIEAYLALPR